jgi:cell division protein FtsZ
MGIGEASGEDRAVMAARMAISSPLLEVSINGGQGYSLQYYWWTRYDYG